MIGGDLALDRPVGEQRAGFARLLELTAIGMPEHRCEPVTLARVPCLELRPAPVPDTRDDRLLVFVHGGGYSLGSATTHRPLAARLARALELPALLPDYRLAPEHPCPAALDDLLAVWRALPSAVQAQAVLAGDSAGGGLALALSMILRDAGEPLPAALILLSPWTDLTISGESVDRFAERDALLTRAGLEFMAARYAGDLAADDFRVSPLFGRFEGLPPTLIQVGGNEALLDDARRAAQSAERAGVNVTLQIWDGQGHVFQATPMLEAASSAIAAIRVWNGQRPTPAIIL